jgi:hypothetical protein
MAEEKGYQGWKNYETWAVALWFDNERGLYEMWREDAQYIADNIEDYESEYLTDEQAVVHELSDRMKDWVEENNPLADKPDMYSDLLNAAISEVDFDEIAKHSLPEDLEFPEEEED